MNCSCPEARDWWNCGERGCRKQALERYAGVMIDRDRMREPRPEHDTDTAGRPLRQGP